MVEFNARNFRTWSIMGINPCIWSVAFPEIIADDPDALAMTADLARYSGMVRTQSKFPDRFYNFGIAEQNMVGTAAGMAMSGYHVFMTTYAPFITYRCADQIRHLLGNLNLNIKAIGSAAGLSAGLSGNALLALGDMAFMRSIPNMQVFSPADCVEAVKIMLAVSKMNLPTYIRFCGATNIPAVYQQDYDFKIGKAVVLRRGAKILLAGTGLNIVANALKAAELIEEKTGISVEVANFHTIKPIDTDYLEQIRDFDLIVSIEEHSVIGGLGSAIAEFGIKRKCFPRQVFIGVEDKLYTLGKRDFMLDQCGLTAEKIADRIIKEIKND